MPYCIDNMLTSEESGLAIYAKKDIPTVSAHTKADTPLEDLNLNWRERDLPERERTKHVHRLHPYLGKYIPQLVEIFLRKYFKPGETVIDPFAGSGTTLVQANELGINSIGFDVSAFNVLLCRAKLTKYDVQKARVEVLDVLHKVKQLTQSASRQQLPLWNGAAESRLECATENEYLTRWFAPKALFELLTYRTLISTGSYIYTDLLNVILSRSARSARLTTHFDLDFPKRPQLESYWCYKHSRECRPTEDAYKFLERYSFDSIDRVAEFNRQRTAAKWDVIHSDSRKANIPEIDGLMTSPPYVGLIDYHEQHAYGYHLLGLQDNRESEIGAASGGSSQKAKAKYQDDIGEVLLRAHQKIRKGGRMIVVAGDRANLYPEIGRRIGVEVEAVVQRHVNRRTGRRTTNFYESVFIWRKNS